MSHYRCACGLPLSWWNRNYVPDGLSWTLLGDCFLQVHQLQGMQIWIGRFSCDLQEVNRSFEVFLVYLFGIHSSSRFEIVINRLRAIFSSSTIEIAKWSDSTFWTPCSILFFIKIIGTKSAKSKWCMIANYSIRTISTFHLTCVFALIHDKSHCRRWRVSSFLVSIFHIRTLQCLEISFWEQNIVFLTLFLVIPSQLKNAR